MRVSLVGVRTAARVAVPAAVLLLACLAVPVNNDRARADGHDDPVARVGGADRFATAAELAAGVEGDTLWVATGLEFADALAAAATGTGPVLLARPQAVPSATREAVATFDGRVVAVGGTAVLSEQVVAELAAERIAGADRFDTAALIAAQTHPDGAETVYLATGFEFADALAAAPAAAEADAPLLLTGDTLPAATADALRGLAPETLIVVGGTAALAEDVVAAAAAAAGGASVERVSGLDRYATAAAIATHRDLEGSRLAYLATGEDFADALAAAPAATSDQAALLLTRQRSLPEPTSAAITALGIDRVTIAGGTAAVSEAVANRVRVLLGFAVDFGEKTVSFFDVGQADATLIQTDEATILVDAGHWQRSDVVGHLTAAGVDELDVLALTHWHADHIGQVTRVLEAFDVDQVWTQPGSYDSATYRTAIAAIQASGATVRHPAKGQSFTVGDLTVDIVGPGPDANLSDVHDANMSLRTTLGEASVLFTGDADAATEARYVARVPHLLDADVYQVGHHGSATSTAQAFLDTVDPDIAVYSAGAGNQYGHPHAVVLDRLHAAGVDVYGTDVHGTVTALFDGAAWRVETTRTGTPAPGDRGTNDREPAPACVDLNTAGFDELQEIIHIGPVRAQAIIDGRPWSSVDELIQISGIGEVRLADIKAQGLASVSC